MATLEKINTTLSELETKHGASIPLADLRQALAKVFEATVASSSATVSGNCSAATTKGALCQKKATKVGSDGKSYCAQHHTKLFGASPSAPAAASGSAAPASKPAATKKPTCSTGKGTPNPPCEHSIKGSNPRVCGKNGKEKASDGKWYCGTHLKSHQAPAAPSAVNDNKAASVMGAAAGGYQTPEIFMDDSTGLAKDQNGLLYVADYDGKGVSVCARSEGGQVVDLREADIKFCETRALPIPVVPADVRAVIIAKPEERAKYMSTPQAQA